jgi:Holliday junction DNA helicase RuvB
MPLLPEIRERLQAQYEEQVSDRQKRSLEEPSSSPGNLVKRGDDIFAGGDYPAKWDGFIGQAEAIKQLQAAVASAKGRGKPLDHVLLASGAQGIGKTTLAQIIAHEMGVGFLAVSGPLSVDDARQLLRQMEDGDILFWDEIHLAVAGNRNRADWILPLLTDSVLMTKKSVEHMPRVTVIGATTDVGKLPQTIISRFMVRPVLNYYTDDEGVMLAETLGDRMDVILCDHTDYARVARAADNNPRDIRMILTAVRDIAFAGEGDLALAFQWAGVTHDGLSRVAQDMLVVLLDAPDNTASLETIQASLGEPGPMRHAEQKVIQKGYVLITGRGRKLTERGIERAIQLTQGV